LRRDVEAADRNEDVREAARSWRRAGAIESTTLDSILRAYPDDRSRLKPAFRVLLFLFTLVAVGSAFAVLAFNEAPTGALLYIFALGSIALTEVQIGELRRSGAGAEDATALLALAFSVAALAWSIGESSEGSLRWRFLCAAAAALAAAAAWRWGISIFGIIAAACLFLAMAFWSGARTSWVLAAIALAAPLLSLSESARLSPSQRRAADAALVTVLAALYFAVHLYSYDAGLLEKGDYGYYEATGDRPGRPLHIAGTALVPLALLALSIVFRRPLLLRMGVLLGVASLVTLRFYVHVAPLWVVLIACGGAAVALGMILNRYLESGAGRERHGFTAEPLFGDESRAKAVEAGLGMAPAPAASASSGKPGRLEGAGGEFGGGGASGRY
jgi:MFS family permease